MNIYAEKVVVVVVPWQIFLWLIVGAIAIMRS